MVIRIMSAVWHEHTTIERRMREIAFGLVIVMIGAVRRELAKLLRRMRKQLRRSKRPKKTNETKKTT